MKRHLLIHAGWAIVAIAAFVIGSQRRTELASTDSHREPEALGREKMSRAGLKIGDPKKRSAADRNQAAAERGTEEQIGLADLVAEAFGDPNPLRRSLAFAQLLERINAENGEEIFLALKSLGKGRASGEQLKLIFFAWGNKAGAAALESEFGEMDEETRDFFHSQMLAGWASADSSAAIAWFRSLDDAGNDRARTLNNGLITGLMAIADDITQASDDLFGPADEEGPEVSPDYVRELARNQIERLGFDAALQWGEGLPAGEAKAAALDSIVHDYGKRDPQAASAWAEQFVGEDWAAAVVSRVAEDWAEEDPVASISWLESLPQGAGRSKASFTAFREWSRRDSAAASTYLLEMESSSARDHAVMALSDTIEGNDPEAAVKWAGEIGDPDMRASAIVHSARTWFRRDEVAAREWLETSGLPEEVLKKIMP